MEEATTTVNNTSAPYATEEQVRQQQQQSERKKKQQKPPAKKEKKRLRILMLHGYYQNGDIFEIKTGSFRKILKSDVDFVYVTAPHIAEFSVGGSQQQDQDGMDESDNAAATTTTTTTTGAAAPVDQTRYTWFKFAPTTDYRNIPEYFDSKQTFDYLKDVFRKQGPFDGVLGFSQGGIAAAILCCMMNQDDENNTKNEGEEEENPIRFRFAIIVSAYPPSPAEYRRMFDQPEIKAKLARIKTLVIYGKTDTLIKPEWTLELAALFGANNNNNNSTDASSPADADETTSSGSSGSNVTVFAHEKGHVVPVTSAAKKCYKDFIGQFL